MTGPRRLARLDRAGLLFVLLFCNAFGVGAFGPLLPEIGRTQSLPDWQLGFVASAFGFARMAAAMPVGMLVVCRLAAALMAAPLILVLGHDSCGAVDATLKALKDDKQPPGLIPSLVDAIAPAAKAAMREGGDVLDKAIRQNVIDNVTKLKSTAPILNEAVEQGKLKVVGGVYRLASGAVEVIAQG